MAEQKIVTLYEYVLKQEITGGSYKGTTLTVNEYQCRETPKLYIAEKKEGKSVSFDGLYTSQIAKSSIGKELSTYGGLTTMICILLEPNKQRAFEIFDEKYRDSISEKRKVLDDLTSKHDAFNRSWSMLLDEKREYAVQIRNASDNSFERQLDVFKSRAEAISAAVHVGLDPSVYTEVVEIRYDLNDNEVGTEVIYSGGNK